MACQRMDFGNNFWSKDGPKIDAQNVAVKVAKMMPKGYQHGNKIDTQYDQQPMPEQVAKQIMKIINNHVILMCKNTQIHYTKKFVEGAVAETRWRI